ncbi:hypothetical protein EIN_448660 [Entamoeba invadens IP1]|uniref:Uncharacterized protein n=1 Tax=Entamoeba invadens IP1 TaxID=370355 RepID=L7FLT5_ENTIV|nr:hypothetical protein EIN_448660 [Entamoeba invadens IP1]ELP89095.1 hypothetical protein EIN_448660 [Entamoeba invadens IP1]|eukprot:XP_004255866.1 hypothetical protein EIN_448660 [Entamoeba invadens IP1]
MIDSINCKYFEGSVCKTCEDGNYKDVKDGCIEYSSKGCLRCNGGFYLMNSVCVQCEYPCTQCSNITYCTKCDAYSYTKNGLCFQINEILSVCGVMMSTYDGCVACKDGYMRSSDGKQCVKCDVSCQTCSNDGNCILCSEDYFRTPNNNTKLCNSYNQLFNCLNKTTSGCITCEFGFALINNLCYKCDENCTICDSTLECTECAENNILYDKKCVHYTTISHCISANNSKCVSCENGFKLNNDGILCGKSVNYALIVGLSVACVVCILFIIVTIIITFIIIYTKRQENKKQKTVCVFKGFLRIRCILRIKTILIKKYFSEDTKIKLLRFSSP